MCVNIDDFKCVFVLVCVFGCVCVCVCMCLQQVLLLAFQTSDLLVKTKSMQFFFLLKCNVVASSTVAGLSQTLTTLSTGEINKHRSPCPQDEMHR